MKCSFKFIHSTSESSDIFQSLFYIQYSKTGNLYIFGISQHQTFISQILTVLGPFGEKFNFFSSFEFEAKKRL